MPRHDGNTYRPKTRHRRLWLRKRGLLDLTEKDHPTNPPYRAEDDTE